jgi:hypothetical protein
MATIALQDGKVVLKDGNASCSCCTEFTCPTIPESPYGIVLSETEYNNFKQGGSFTFDATMSEGTCSSNLNTNGFLPTCAFNISVSEDSCFAPSGSISASYFNLTCQVGQEDVTGLYKMRYNGQAQCPYLLYPLFCYSFGYFINDIYEVNPPVMFAPIGTVTITNRGSSVQFSIWSFPGSASASATIDITDPIPP